MTRLQEFLVEVSFTQLMDEDQARKIGFNSRTWNKALAQDLVVQINGFFTLTWSGRQELARVRAAMSRGSR